MSSTGVESSFEKTKQQQQQREILKNKLIQWGQRTDRGFTANANDQKNVRQIVFELAKYNDSTQQPACPYYYKGNDSHIKEDNNNYNNSTIQGKWTLIFTDAPDITGLKTNNNQNPFVELGRIGQDCCQPPIIANVIEWKAPEWIESSPWVPPFLKGPQRMQRADSGRSKRPRILQKVLTKGKATASNPSLVKLDIVGLQIIAPDNSSNGDDNDNNNTPQSSRRRTLQQAIAQNGLIAGLVQQWPIDWHGPQQQQSLPLGEFEILFLDETMRITRTGQNYIAVNTRITNPAAEWF